MPRLRSRAATNQACTLKRVPDAILAERKAELVRRHGPWTAYNVHLGGDVYTMAPGVVGAGEQNVRRITQVLADLHPGGCDGLRVLDLGAYEGAFSIELALRGAQVTAVEGRSEHVAKARFAKEALDLGGLELLQADVRDLATLGLGRFDVVLCLGIAYHLAAPAVFSLLETAAGLCDGTMIVETQTSLPGSDSFEWRGSSYRGHHTPEDPAMPGAALDGEASFWLTRPSLLNALQAVGFTSVCELLVPTVPAIASFTDHVTLVARKGEPAALRSMPQVPATPQRLPENPPRWAHPAQGPVHALRDRIRRFRGGGLATMFKKPS